MWAPSQKTMMYTDLAFPSLSSSSSLSIYCMYIYDFPLVPLNTNLLSLTISSVSMTPASCQMLIMLPTPSFPTKLSISSLFASMSPLLSAYRPWISGIISFATFSASNSSLSFWYVSFASPSFRFYSFTNFSYSVISFWISSNNRFIAFFLSSLIFFIWVRNPSMLLGGVIIT